MPFHSLEDALKDFSAGKMVIVMDDENRENEGDLILAAEFVTPEKMAFIIRHTGGVVCLALSQHIANLLNLPPMVEKNTSPRSTAYTVSIDAARDISTGISAEDRSKTVLTAILPDARPEDLVRPGHVFPLRAEEGGVLWRGGHTEASVDLCRLSGLREGAVLSELMLEDGSMMRYPELFSFAEKYGIKIISIADLISYRRKTERFIRLDAESDLETDTGSWKIRIYRDLLHDTDHIALIRGVIDSSLPTLVRVHSECITGEVFGSKHCDCGLQLDKSMEMIASEGRGVFLYMKKHEGRGIGLSNKIKAYDLQKKGMDTVEANLNLGFPEDLRTYGVGAQILADIGLGKIRLLTNNPKKMGGITGYGLDIVEQIPIEIPPNALNYAYLKAKKNKLGHILSMVH